MVFETIAANNVDFLIVSPEFFTIKNSWHIPGEYGTSINSTSPHYINDLQALLLSGRYQDTTVFRNFTASECRYHYTRPFITDAGHGFAVPNKEYRDSNGPNAANSLLLAQSGSGEMKADYDSISCKFTYNALLVPLERLTGSPL